MLEKITKEISEIIVKIEYLISLDPLNYNVGESNKVECNDYVIYFKEHNNPVAYDKYLKKLEKEFIISIKENLKLNSKEEYEYLLRLKIDIEKLGSYIYPKSEFLWNSGIKKYKYKSSDEGSFLYDGDIGNPEISVFLTYQKAFLDKLIIFLDSVIQDLKVSNPNIIKGDKLKWKSSPSLFGYIFGELVEKGYLESPETAQGKNYSHFARICIECFDIKSTPNSLAKFLNPISNKLEDYNKDQFKIPPEKGVNRRSKN